MFKDFKAFIMRGNVVDLAVGVIIGAAFGAIVKSIVDDMLMPVIGLATGGIDFSSHFILLKAGAKVPPPYNTPADAKAAGAVTINYGSFINTVLDVPDRRLLRLPGRPCRGEAVPCADSGTGNQRVSVLHEGHSDRRHAMPGVHEPVGDGRLSA